MEGCSVGITKAIDRGIPRERLLKHDLRMPLDLKRSFDIVLCTEVAEHIECPFSGQLVQTLVRHGRIIWFSSESPGTNPDHYHHCNEQPNRFWRELFHFFGFTMFPMEPSVVQNLERRGEYVCVDERLLEGDLAPLGQDAVVRGLGQAEGSKESAWKIILNDLLPPIVVQAGRRMSHKTVERGSGRVERGMTADEYLNLVGR